MTASGVRLGVAIVEDDTTADEAITAAFAPTLKANQLRHLPAWPNETIDPITGWAMSNGFGEVRKAMASARASFTFWEIAPTHHAATKTVGEIVSTVDKLLASFRELLRVNPAPFEESASAKEQLLSRILREVDFFLPDQDLPAGENAQNQIKNAWHALILLRAPFAATQLRFSSRKISKPQGKTWSHLKPLLYTVHDLLSRHNVPTGFRNTDVDGQADVTTNKTSNVGQVTFALTKLLGPPARLPRDTCWPVSPPPSPAMCPPKMPHLTDRRTRTIRRNPPILTD
jgi:hypothetical protein